MAAFPYLQQVPTLTDARSGTAVMERNRKVEANARRSGFP
jgi:hypothetical protein